MKHQGDCGSCWAFSTIAAIESAWAIKGNPLTVMSEQELMDCTREYGNNGCDGGWSRNSYRWLSKNKTMKESDYPYTGKEGDGNCKYDATKGITTVPTYYYYGVGSIDDILHNLADQPLNVAVAAENNVFFGYSSGIITSNMGCPTDTDHEIVAVGWGVENGVQYYVVRNSWGTGWGEQGFARIATEGGENGVCGI